MGRGARTSRGEARNGISDPETNPKHGADGSFVNSLKRLSAFSARGTMFEKPHRTGFFAHDVPTLKFLLGYSVPTKLPQQPAGDSNPQLLAFPLNKFRTPLVRTSFFSQSETTAITHKLSSGWRFVLISEQAGVFGCDSPVVCLTVRNCPTPLHHDHDKAFYRFGLRNDERWNTQHLDN